MTNDDDTSDKPSDPTAPAAARTRKIVRRSASTREQPGFTPGEENAGAPAAEGAQGTEGAAPAAAAAPAEGAAPQCLVSACETRGSAATPSNQRSAASRREWSVAIFAGGALVLAAARAAVGAARLTRLSAVDPTASHKWPTVSIVVAARDEERHIGGALASLCRLDYPSLEFVVVDDRSTDRTGLLIARAAAGDGRIRVVRVESLPPRWLGKTHALAAGAARAAGDVILFTDADVHFRPDALTRAVALMTTRNLDHLAVIPAITSPSAGVRAAVAGFALF
ncbi:MAG: glycosyltransferase, partial [Byssovorax sp.]